MDDLVQDVAFRKYFEWQAEQMLHHAKMVKRKVLERAGIFSDVCEKVRVDPLTQGIKAVFRFHLCGRAVKDAEDKERSAQRKMDAEVDLVQQELLQAEEEEKAKKAATAVRERQKHAERLEKENMRREEEQMRALQEEEKERKDSLQRKKLEEIETAKREAEQRGRRAAEQEKQRQEEVRNAQVEADQRKEAAEKKKADEKKKRDEDKSKKRKEEEKKRKADQATRQREREAASAARKAAGSNSSSSSKQRRQQEDGSGNSSGRERQQHAQQPAAQQSQSQQRGSSRAGTTSRAAAAGSSSAKTVVSSKGEPTAAANYVSAPAVKTTKTAKAPSAGSTQDIEAAELAMWAAIKSATASKDSEGSRGPKQDASTARGGNAGAMSMSQAQQSGVSVPAAHNHGHTIQQPAAPSTANRVPASSNAAVHANGTTVLPPQQVQAPMQTQAGVSAGSHILPSHTTAVHKAPASHATTAGVHPPTTATNAAVSAVHAPPQQQQQQQQAQVALANQGNHAPAVRPPGSVLGAMGQALPLRQTPSQPQPMAHIPVGAVVRSQALAPGPVIGGQQQQQPPPPQQQHAAAAARVRADPSSGHPVQMIPKAGGEYYAGGQQELPWTPGVGGMHNHVVDHREWSTHAHAHQHPHTQPNHDISAMWSHSSSQQQQHSTLAQHGHLHLHSQPVGQGASQHVRPPPPPQQQPQQPQQQAHAQHLHQHPEPHFGGAIDGTEQPVSFQSMLHSHHPSSNQMPVAPHLMGDTDGGVSVSAGAEPFMPQRDNILGGQPLLSNGSQDAPMWALQRDAMSADSIAGGMGHRQHPLLPSASMQQGVSGQGAGGQQTVGQMVPHPSVAPHGGLSGYDQFGHGLGPVAAAENSNPVGHAGFDEEDDGADIWAALGQAQADFQQDVPGSNNNTGGGVFSVGGGIW